MKVKKSALQYLFCTLVFLFAESALGQNSWIVYRHPQFTFTYPANWKVESPQLTTTKVKFGAYERGHVANCAVTAYPFKETANLSQKQINQLFFGQKFKPHDVLYDIGAPDIQVSSWAETRLSNTPAFYGEIDYSLQVLANQFYMHAFVGYIFKPRYVWRILCAGSGSSPREAKASFDYWDQTILRIMGTFLFEINDIPH